MNKYICVHGHFYQPPRENPWLREIELQDSAFPYHDWNERITAECYAPNAASRILDEDKKIVDIVNNYSKISFNFGPTLLSWMEKKKPDVYRSIIEADILSRNYFGGHGSAIAQVYNHIIMPLASKRDKETQVRWGIADFQHRFGRYPEGMWLAETAADLETLEILAQENIKFTILAPRQASEIKEINGTEWESVSEGRVDPKRPYRCFLPSGKFIDIFFYDGPISQDIGFGGLLSSGEVLRDRLMGAFSAEETGPEIVSIATDGETYGHHQVHGDMALAYCVYEIETKQLAKITVFGEYLEKFPPQHEVRIYDNSSWSCIHGVERWKSDCGCNSGTKHGWEQKWREPLREAFDSARDKMADFYEQKAVKYSQQPWKLRDDYIKVILEPGEDSIQKLLQEHSGRKVEGKELTEAARLLELQHNALLMYTSCGWFFDEVSGIETTQIMQYAARSIQLLRQCGGPDLEPEFVNTIAKAKSNIHEYKDGARVFEKFVKPAMIDLFRVSVHFAVSSLFEEYRENPKVYCYSVNVGSFEKLEAGRQRLAIGHAYMKSDITFEEEKVSFAVLHLGDHNIVAGVRPYTTEETFNEMHGSIKEAFLSNSVQDSVRAIDERFEKYNYSLWHLFKAEQNDILNKIFQPIMNNISALYSQIYESNYQIMSVIKEKGIYVPKAFLTSVEFVLNEWMKELMETKEPQPEELGRVVTEIKKWGVEPDRNIMRMVVGGEIADIMEMALEETDGTQLMEKTKETLEVLNDMKKDINFWRAQNVYYRMGKRLYGLYSEKAASGDADAMKWLDAFNSIGELLGVKVF
ncbi:MAG: glycoside hydrolase [Candidatus Goldiibacteriota bacterium HGW-Goldbacteria-1]|jgi:alpha-amylase/alpha-mannosidase (GH57 family)|nr:MAG: glycoside hydrolase [Candidatus Goldiibacteriota bacterium HGW-Goldbacteria-1]